MKGKARITFIFARWIVAGSISFCLMLYLEVVKTYLQNGGKQKIKVDMLRPMT